MNAPSPAAAQRPVALWLLAVCALLFAMIVLGGVTRLTHSGLSIVEWEPIVGTIPPLSQDDWNQLFEEYRRTPEFRLKNHWMGVEDFKGIFWLEYFHRLLGRLIGLAFAVPLAWFVLRRQIDRPLAWKLAGIFVLGGLQGAMGWYMVASGLVADPRVSHLRLTAHLGLAFLIFAATFWVALGRLRAPAIAAAGRDRQSLARVALALAALVFVMVLSGGLVAGIRAGYLYNTFPLMNGHFMPPDTWSLAPAWRNVFENATTIQFNHRLIAWALAVLVPLFWWRALRSELPAGARLACHLLLAALAAQITLGIATLLGAVPMPLAAAHQGGAVVLLGTALYCVHRLRYD
jgi:cytochrome c oxidase assembly protein subunit 15